MGLQSIVICLSVCEYACLSARITRKPHSRTSPNFCACCLWFSLLWQRCDTLCTSSFTDHFMFSYHGTYGRTDGHDVCSSLAPVDVNAGQVQAASAHWLGWQACWDTSAGHLLSGGWRSCCQKGSVHFTMCFMLVVSCTTGRSVLYMSVMFLKEYFPSESLNIAYM